MNSSKIIQWTYKTFLITQAEGALCFYMAKAWFCRQYVEAYYGKRKNKREIRKRGSPNKKIAKVTMDKRLKDFFCLKKN
jgi:hypothetical protein